MLPLADIEPPRVDFAAWEMFFYHLFGFLAGVCGAAIGLYAYLKSKANEKRVDALRSNQQQQDNRITTVALAVNPPAAAPIIAKPQPEKP